MKVAEAIARVLKAEGIEHLICYPRQALIDACAAIGIRPVICRQERVGAGIADGISRSTYGKRIGVFAMQGGPGVENAFAGAAQLFGDNVPVLLMPAAPRRPRASRRRPFSAVDNFRTVTKWAASINEPARVIELMRRAFHLMRNGKPGPVLIELPVDIGASDRPGEFDYAPPQSMARRARSGRREGSCRGAFSSRRLRSSMPARACSMPARPRNWSSSPN